MTPARGGKLSCFLCLEVQRCDALTTFVCCVEAGPPLCLKLAVAKLLPLSGTRAKRRNLRYGGPNTTEAPSVSPQRSDCELN